MVEFVNKPLFQRTTHQRVEEIAMRETIRLNVVRSLPKGWLATIANASASEVRVSARGELVGRYVKVQNTHQ